MEYARLGMFYKQESFILKVGKKWFHMEVKMVLYCYRNHAS